MYFRVFFYTISILIVTFLGMGCGISLRVYRPFPSERSFDYVKKMDHIQILVKDENRMKMGVYDGYFFQSEGLPNEYGPLSYLIRKELSLRGDRFPLLIDRGGKIFVDEFQLASIDRCSKNLTFVRLKAKIQIVGYGEEEYSFYDEIDSRVTNCYLTGSILTVVPLIWYVPYNGFRGNREDQLNQLGRNSLSDFFKKLESVSGYNGSNPVEETPEPKPVKPKTVPTKQEPVDPKLKEILDSL
ncbi:hypothetical protein ND861_10125 [Leptospira sp. 2 VSF19]|uniref:Lipoprotein n=1 Tax=Leptospira soteropolitanensis TaxID=2950025 RepID=A0AAW5VLD7_9LEPT|nr:hypothetical protein [Leptospira soteropolitanensis]MCW7492435.1 hypothetical protein [Leptospira soteropolitanensis]MCW7500486.1 hypothetical protein [Leptospira soteropolitanensis]MCW7522844.1 hypothetical protein [Leptospira soteropolitanensis]MCW7526703.1 hypothetical protein [Leptospira soteropolitanensis]MCW7530456.1 hypothetical protein [Leptospira soteropolitanensis]